MRDKRAAFDMKRFQQLPTMIGQNTISLVEKLANYFLCLSAKRIRIIYFELLMRIEFVEGSQCGSY